MPEFPKITRTPDRLTLEGELTAPVVLYSAQAMSAIAQANTNHAAANNSSCAIFIGCPHLEHLTKTQLPVPVILIEPNLLIAKTYQDELQKAELIFITGEWGDFPPDMSPSFFPTLLMQEMGQIALKLMQLPDAYFLNPNVYSLKAEGQDNGYLDHVLQTVHLVCLAKKFHAEHKTIYENYKQQSRSQTNVILTNNHTLTAEDLRYLDFIPGPFVCLSMANEHHAHQAVAKTNPERFCFDLNAYEAFLQKIISLNPAHVVSFNRRPFQVLADMLIYEEMLNRLNLPLTSYFTDWFSHMGQVYQGGLSFLLHDELWPNRHKKYITPYPVQTCLAPPRSAFEFEPLAYADKNTVCRAPLDQKQCLRDIAIVHQTRLALNEIPEVNELFSLLHPDPNDALGRSINRMLFLTRQKLRECDWPMANSYFWRSILNTIEFITYNQLRLSNVVQAVKAMSGLNITVYGKDWHKLLPQQMCGGTVPFEELENIYRTSALTIDLSQTFAANTPHANALEALKAGSYPILLAPLFPASKSEAPFIKSLPRFESFSELATKVKTLLQHPAICREQILSLQAEFLAWTHSKDVKSQTHVAKPAEAFDTRISPHDDALLDVIIGYLLCLSGARKAAVDFWSQAILDKGFHMPVLVQRCRLTAQAIGITDVANRIAL